VRFAGAGEIFDWLQPAGLHEIGNAELGADQKAAEMCRRSVRGFGPCFPQSYR